MENHTRRQILKSGVATGVIGAIAGCSGSSGGGGGGGNDSGGGGGNGSDGGGGNFPSQPLTTVIPYSEGGGVDQTYRQIQSYFREAVGTNLKPTYLEGSGTRRGVQSVLRADSLHTYGITASPESPAAVATDEARGTNTTFKIKDMMPIGNHIGQASIIRIRQDEDRFQTIQELVNYAANNQVSIGASGPRKRNMLANIKLAQATDATFQYVPYDGGGPTETALLQGELDVANRSVYNSLDVINDTKCIAVFAEENPWPELTDDAPPINDALGTDIGFEGTNGRYYWFVDAAKAESNPNQFDYLVNSFQEAIENEQYISDLESGDYDQSGQIEYMPPQETLEANVADYETYKEFIPLFEKFIG